MAGRATGAQYRIRVRGRFDDERMARMEEFSDKVVVAESVLSSNLDDQAELHGLLERLQDMGFELLAVRRDEP
jgi:hypothetical protein